MLVEDCFRGLEYTPLADWDRPGTSEDRLALALAQPPVFGPGEDWACSNSNHLVLGLVIDKVSGLGSAPTSSEGSCARCG
ncbi:hypothetical protein AB0L39_13855 [Streptomyces parvus]|uniref:hypothetical protein n=1 Tax=Streptomyces parvus TaxID=66428 RepID=UPI003438EF81